MKRLHITPLKGTFFTCILLVIAAGVYIFSCLYTSRTRVQTAMGKIVAYTHYELTQDGKVLLIFDADTMSGSACLTRQWALLPNNKGTIDVIISNKVWENKYQNANPQDVLEEKSDSIDSLYKDAHWKVAELNYYLHSHSVTDEGFNMISAYNSGETLLRDSAHKMLDSLSHIKGKKHLKINYVKRFVFKGQLCHPVKRKKDGVWLFQLKNPDALANTSSIPSFIANKYIRPNSLSFCPKVPTLKLRPDSLGYSQGETDSIHRPNGYGIWQGDDGTYYEGNWKAGKRDGFGYAIAPRKPLRVGEWKNDRYKGERLVYTSDRIYGIDISKYQHVIGNKKYPINWKNLRISHLGSISKKTISGAVDFPIKFIYVKSTEGASLLNPYYRKDYLAARAHGFKVGSYHFFSPISPAVSQARQFLKHSIIQKGDFPPVLDVEPTREQIEKMGGCGVLFARIRTWLRCVQRETGTKPILYVSQTFVNRYLSKAPDLKHNYQIWIARYGEYKPDVHLIYWQLCPDGHVRGIHGKVDINVFNGYQDAYEKFIKTETVK